MKKYLSSILLTLMVLGLCISQPSQAFAYTVDTTIYYQEIVDIVKIDKGEDRDAKIDEAFKKYENDNLYSTVDSTKSTNQENASYTYIVKRTPINSRDDLIKAMTGKDKLTEEEINKLPQGQRCLLASFDAIEKQKERQGDAYQPRLTFNLTDTTKNGEYDKNGYNTKNSTEPDMKNDFWPTSHTPVWYDKEKDYNKYYRNSTDTAIINLSDVEYKYSNDENITDKAYTVVFHEYSHFLDNTKRDTNVDNYGLDGTHYKNEITTPRMSFIEGWAQYNEMIVDATGTIRDSFINACAETAKLRIETTPDKDSKGTYDENTTVADASYTSLLSTECFNAYLLYRLANECVGADGINEAFIATRWNKNRNIKDLIQRLVKQNQDKAVEICKIIDEVFYGKLSDDSLREMVIGKYVFGDICNGEYLSRSTKLAIEEYIKTRDQDKVNDDNNNGTTTTHSVNENCVVISAESNDEATEEETAEISNQEEQEESSNEVITIKKSKNSFGE